MIHSDRPLRIGIIGAGNVVASYHLPVLSALKDLGRIAWIFDEDAGRARKLADRGGIPLVPNSIESAPDVDAVLVAIPLGFRGKTMEIAIERGWNLLCEKPFAATLEQHDRWVRLGESAGIRIGVGLMRRFFNPTLQAAALVESGSFGRLKAVWAGEGARMRATGRSAGFYQNDPRASGGGALMETGVHLVDQVFRICGADSFDFLKAEQVVWDVGDVETTARATLYSGDNEFPFGVAISRTRDIFNGIVLKFDNFFLTVDLTADGTIRLKDSRENFISELGRNDNEQGAKDIYGAFAMEWRNFLDGLRNGSPSNILADSVRLTTQFVEECYRPAPLTESPQ